jgi:limonene-1,2-epoxide hydrolase
MEQPEPITVVKGFVAAVNRHEMEDIMQYLTDDATVTIRPPLPNTAIESYEGKERIHDLFEQLFAEHTTIIAGNLRTSDNEVSWQGRISSDRFAQIGVDPVEVTGRTTVEGSQVSSFMAELSPEAARKMREAAAAGRPV